MSSTLTYWDYIYFTYLISIGFYPLLYWHTGLSSFLFYKTFQFNNVPIKHCKSPLFHLYPLEQMHCCQFTLLIDFDWATKSNEKLLKAQYIIIWLRVHRYMYSIQVFHDLSNTATSLQFNGHDALLRHKSTQIDTHTPFEHVTNYAEEGKNCYTRSCGSFWRRCSASACSTNALVRLLCRGSRLGQNVGSTDDVRRPNTSSGRRFTNANLTQNNTTLRQWAKTTVMTSKT